MNRLSLILRKIAGIIIFCWAVITAGLSSAHPDDIEIRQQRTEDSIREVSVEFSDTDLSDALRVISEATGVNIVTGGGVEGKVNARFSGVPVREAVVSLIHSCGYSYVEEGGVIRVIEIDKNLLGIDASTPQVLIESKIIEVALGENEQSGVQWDELYADLGNNIEASGEVDFSQASNGLLLNVFSEDMDALINILRRETSSRVLSAPRVVALNDREARILVGEKIAYQQSFGQTNAGITTTSVNFEDVGIKLYVTPHVIDRSTVMVDLMVEVSSVKEWRTLSNGDEVPIISTNYANSRVIVKNSRTLIIGGLIGEDRVESESKVPVLGDIPLIKYLFSHKRVETGKKELTIFISPRIINFATRGVPESEEGKNSDTPWRDKQ